LTAVAGGMLAVAPMSTGRLIMAIQRLLGNALCSAYWMTGPAAPTRKNQLSAP
jgi:hypothetical protein